MNRLPLALAFGSLRSSLPDDHRKMAVCVLKAAYIVGFWVLMAYALAML